MNIAIRPSTANDADDIEVLAREFHAYLRALGDPAAFDWDRTKYLKDGFGADPAFEGLVAVVNERVVGYALYHFGYDTDHGQRYVYLIDLYVSQPCRRGGIGEALMQRVAQIGARRGAELIAWSVVKQNAAAVTFYEKMGAKFVTDVHVMWCPMELLLPPVSIHGDMIPATHSDDNARASATMAFETAMLGHLEDVMRYARSLTRDAADADDLVQETYLRALRGWSTFDVTSDARRWLFAICRHAFLRTRQRESRQVSIEGEPELDAMAAVALHKSAQADGLESLFARIDLGPALARALTDLSDDHRTVVVMVDIEGHGYGDVAAELGVPVGTVRSRLFRARRLLQTALLSFAHDAGFATGAPLSLETDS